MASDRLRVVLLFGPTGVGKTALLERLFRGRAEIVSADALQVYRGLDIGTAKPDTAFRSRLPHHLIDVRDFYEPFSIADFVRLADTAVEDISSRGMVPVISGGTAYYLKGWLLGLPGTPVADPAIRREIAARWKNRSDEELADAVRSVDPAGAARIGARDRYRMLRILEVHAQTGRPLSDFHVPDAPRVDFRTFSIGLRRERAELYARIDQRVNEMFAAGLQQEVESLRARGARREHPGMKGIGYREWFGVEDGGPTPDEGVVRESIARNSRRYAKRQITFFSSLPDVQWFDTSGTDAVPDGMAEAVQSFLDGD